MRSLLTVTTASDTYDLTTLATVKADLGIEGNDENVKLATWITQASRIAATYCRRVFAQETLTETFRPDACEPAREALVLARRPIASITSVTVDDVVIDAAEYEYGAEAGMLFRLDSSGYRSTWCVSKKIVVIYVAGYELLNTLPHDVERAVIMMVRDFRADATRDPNLIEEETFGVERLRWWATGDAKTVLPVEISGLLDPFMNHWVA